MNSIIVSNSTPLIGLATIQRFDLLQDELDSGEAEAIVLAQEMNAEWVLMDEKKGRRKLTQLGLPKMGTLGILLNAKKAGELQAIKPYIETLRHQGFILSHSLIETILREAEETEADRIF